MSADFYIAQYIRDTMRREPKNVGLVVVKDDVCAQQYLGDETVGGDVDLRTARWAKDPKVYRKWVRFWREEVGRGAKDLQKRLMEGNRSNYAMIFGGKVMDSGADTAAQICAHLFPRLVAEIVEPAQDDDGEADASKQQLQKEITGEFDRMGILAGRIHDEAPNPVWVNKPIVVSPKLDHTPSYFQNAGKKYVMEIANFTTPQKALAKDHAGWAAKMFDDVRNLADTVAIVRASKDDLENKTVKYAMAMLESSAKDIVFWNDAGQRRKFLEARREAAYTTSV